MLLNIDTQRVYSALLSGGFSEKQANTVIDTMRSIDLTHLATKEDLRNLRHEIKADFAALELKWEARFAKLEADNILLKWMMGIILASVLSLVMKAYFA